MQAGGKVELDKRLIRFAGAALILLGLGATALALWITSFQVAEHKRLDTRFLIFVPAMALIAWFCLAVGWRLALDRPNRYGSILGPAGWRALALVSGVIAALIGVLITKRREFDMVPLAMLPAIGSYWCWMRAFRMRSNDRASTRAPH